MKLWLNRRIQKVVNNFSHLGSNAEKGGVMLGEASERVAEGRHMVGNLNKLMKVYRVCLNMDMVKGFHRGLVESAVMYGTLVNYGHDPENKSHS